MKSEETIKSESKESSVVHMVEEVIDLDSDDNDNSDIKDIHDELKVEIKQDSLASGMCIYC